MNTRENSFKSFVRETYGSASPIPYIITAQVVSFILVHIIDLLSFSDITDSALFSSLTAMLSLPYSFSAWLLQPWSIVTHTLVYHHIFNILFDCLWLYWIGNLFLTFLSRRQFWTVFAGGIFAGALIYLLVGQTGFLGDGQLWNSTSFGLAAMISAVTVLIPTYEMRLFLFGNVKLRTIAIVYLALELLLVGWNNPQMIIPLISAAALGFLFVQQLRKGKDWSNYFVFKKRRKLKVVHRNTASQEIEDNLNSYPTQEQIDQILDKISKSGYDSLTSREKEVLFKASKQDQE